MNKQYNTHTHIYSEHYTHVLDKPYMVAWYQDGCLVGGWLPGRRMVAWQEDGCLVQEDDCLVQEDGCRGVDPQALHNCKISQVKGQHQGGVILFVLKYKKCLKKCIISCVLFVELVRLPLGVSNKKYSISIGMSTLVVKQMLYFSNK